MIAKDTLLTASDYGKLREMVQSRETRSLYGQVVESLGRDLQRRRVVDSRLVPKTVVTMNSTVRIRDLISNQRDTFTLVYPEQADINEGRISVVAPLGAALLGAWVGQIIECLAPLGVRRMKVEKIVYQPEAAGDYHL